MMVSVEVFRNILRSFKVPLSSAGVAVSGGSDSVALTYLAKQVFNNVIGITIDHQLRPESRNEALKTQEIVHLMGVEHELLSIVWPEGPPSRGKIQIACRDERYKLLLNECEKRRLDMLLVGHHKDDQIETFIYRLSRGSGINGLSGILPLVYQPHSPKIPIIRPLLGFSKESLQQFCLNKKLNWIEDPTNSHPMYCWRNAIRQILKNHIDLREGIFEIMNTCSEARSKMEKEVCDVMDKMVRIDTTYGYILVKYSIFNQLSPPVARRVLEALIKFTSGVDKPLRTPAIVHLHGLFRSGTITSNYNLGKCNIFHYNEQYFIVAKQFLPKDQCTQTPIKIGHIVHWDNRFDVLLSPLKNTTKQGLHYHDNTFYIRHMTQNDYVLASKGIRKVKKSKLAPELSRGGLPVIVDRHGNVVLIPHFKVIERDYGITCMFKYQPKKELKDYICVTNT